MLPYDLLELTFESLDTVSQICLRQVTRITYENLQVTNFHNNCDKIILQRLTDDIVKNYQHITRLCASANPKITNVNHLTALQELYAGHGCGITNVNNLTNLRVLHAAWDCGIDQIGISKLQYLVELNVKGNHKITNVNHLTQLRKLDAAWGCEIDQTGISELHNLVILYMHVLS